MIRSTLALLAFAGAAFAQTTTIPAPGSGQPLPPGGAVPAIPVNNPAAAFGKLPEALQKHLLAWEKQTGGLQTLYVECEREVNNQLRNAPKKYSGAIRCMKPNLAYLRIDNAQKKEDFMAYICDGKMVHEYSGLDKTVMQHVIPPGGAGNVGDNLLLEFMSGAMTAKDIAGRFTLSLLKEDQHYIYIDVKPVLAKDQKEFDSLILVLFGGTVKGMEYLPAKIRMVKGQDVDEWTFKKPMPNAAGIKAQDFNFIQPPKDWQLKKADGGPKVARP